MKKKHLLYGSMAILSIMAVKLLFLAKARSKKSERKLPSFDPIEKYVDEQMHRLKIPGASLAIIEGKEIAYQRGFGLARPGGETPTPITPFFIGSLTKSITALAIMQLVEAGKAELDTTVQHYLPWFCVADPEASAQITVRHLLNQTSGFSFLESNVILAELDDTPGAAERQARALSIIKLKHPVGEVVEYSNVNYNLLGLIIETVSGETYPDYIQKHIFTPLEMNHSYTSKAPAQLNGLAIGYRHWFGFPVPAYDLPVPIGSLASGQLISCSEDMSHYLIAHLNGGRYGDNQVLSAAGIDELQRGVKEYIAFGNPVGRYAMGWFDQDIGRTRVLSHGGNVPDFSAFMSIVPEQKQAMVLLFNADPYGLPMITDEIGSNLTAILAGIQPEPIKLDYIQWIFRFLPLIPLLQLWGVITALLKLNQWLREPTDRPKGGKLWIQHILLPLLPDVTLAAALAYLRSSRLLNFMDLFMPDLAWITRISGGFATFWASLRTRLILQAIRKP